jgi:hypothetical protein
LNYLILPTSDEYSEPTRQKNAFVLQGLTNAQGIPVTIPYVSANYGFQFVCMTAMPDDKSFAIVGGYEFM